MKGIRDVKGTALKWIQPHAGRHAFELMDGEDIIEILTWKKMSGTLAEAVSADSGWTFKREGFLKPRITIRLAGSEDNMAAFKPGWAGDGLLELGDGRRFQWAHTGFWAPKWAFLDAEGQHIIDFTPSGGLKNFGKCESSVEISADAKGIKDAGLLLALGWYLMVLMADDMAATMVAVTVL